MQPNSIGDFKTGLLSSVLYGPHNLRGNPLPEQGIVQGGIERHELASGLRTGVAFS